MPKACWPALWWTVATVWPIFAQFLRDLPSIIWQKDWMWPVAILPNTSSRFVFINTCGNIFVSMRKYQLEIECEIFKNSLKCLPTLPVRFEPISFKFYKKWERWALFKIFSNLFYKITSRLLITHLYTFTNFIHFFDIIKNLQPTRRPSPNFKLYFFSFCFSAATHSTIQPILKLFDNSKKSIVMWRKKKPNESN